MTVQHIVDPEQIESQLLHIWEELAKEKMRACLFTLLVFNQLSKRTDYVREIVQKVSEKYPCRVIFITADPETKKPYLKTAVSVVGKESVACDYIDIGVSESELHRVPFVLLPHVVPDLPVSLLWTEDPSKPHPLFHPLSQLATRVIFDSESADSLLLFSQKVLSLRQQRGIDTADFNWARIQGWRELIASLFHSGENLDQIKDIRITYNGKKTEFFCHLKIQSLYLLSWISSRLKWNFKKASKKWKFFFENQTAEIHSSEWENLGPGTIISVDLATADGHLYQCCRIPTEYHQVTIQISSPDQCQLPYQFMLGKTAAGQSLVKEIFTEGTSEHYLEMLKNLSQLDRDQLC